jgi:5'-nucleotidase
MAERPLILITNDDGITSKGIKVLIEEMAELGEVYVMAPDSPNSGMGHAITVASTLHIKKLNRTNVQELLLTALSWPSMNF